MTRNVENSGERSDSRKESKQTPLKFSPSNCGTIEKVLQGGREVLKKLTKYYPGKAIDFCPLAHEKKIYNL